MGRRKPRQPPAPGAGRGSASRRPSRQRRSRWVPQVRADPSLPDASSRASPSTRPASRPTRRRWSDPVKRSNPAASCASAASTAHSPMTADASILPPALAGEGRGEGHDASPDPSLIHVLRRLELIEARVRSAVARRRTTEPETDDRFRGLYISQAHVDRLLTEKSAPPPPDAGAAQAREDIEATPDAAEPAAADPRFRRLARNFRLDEIDIELLLI